MRTHSQHVLTGKKEKSIKVQDECKKQQNEEKNM
jgi:hypothetical protein